MTEDDLRSILSINLKRYRNQRSFTQAEFARKIDISIPFLSDVENGKKWVSHNTLFKMAKVLDIDAYELLKPKQILPDNTIDILEKFLADFHSEFGKTLNNLYANYVDILKR